MNDNPSGFRFRIEKLDESSESKVFDWAFTRCRNLDLEFLAADEGVPADRETVAKAIARSFAPDVRAAAERGCLAGYKAQDAAGGPMPRPPKRPG